MDQQVDIAKLRSIGQSIESKASEYNSEIAKVYSTVSELKNGWDGSDNVAYVSKVESHRGDLESLGKVLNNYGEFLKSVASAIEKRQNQIADAAGKL